MNKLLKSLLVVGLWLVGVFLLSDSVLAMSATGSWRAIGANQAGSIKLTFPAEGGGVNGTFDGGGDHMLFGGRFTGNFSGGWEGSFSGGFSGWWQAKNFNGELIDGSINGSWSGRLNSDGTITASFKNNTGPYALDGRANLTYSTSSFTREYEANKEVSPEVKIVGEEKDVEWKTDILGMNNAYVIVDGKREPLTNEMVLEPGMTIETEGEDGLAVFTTSSGEHIRLQGDGTRVTLMTTDTVEDNQWKEVLDQYTERRAEGSPSFDRNDPNRLKTRTPVTMMQSGQMVVKYETGDGKEGWWNAAFRRDHFEDTKVSSVGFARNEYFDHRGNAVTGIEDSDPVELVVENHSLVEYLYEGDEITIKVYEGEAVGYRINLVSGENEEVARVKAGESLVISVDKYRTGSGDAGMVKGEFNVSEKSEGVLVMEKAGEKEKILRLGIIAGVAVLVGISGWWIIKKRKGKR